MEETIKREFKSGFNPTTQMIVVFGSAVGGFFIFKNKLVVKEVNPLFRGLIGAIVGGMIGWGVTQKTMKEDVFYY